MLQENPKRAASTSLVGSPNRDLTGKRPHLATDLWSEDEPHLQQDNIVKQRLLGKA
ncbi:hypothetical protein M378DRAFT_164278 [Amanita muscaria Koide BX008]|uniref:Uncharacterized protein n=1 Tax=Amanita muscaria (strain Koide BX008) TaxID=946122 RepID=A0A0C2X339_AMAMK|nr:hypothetical protein M378DRAFT_164278 [Amanita muscaria Koide BX008]